MSQAVYGSVNLNIQDMNADLAPTTITEQEVVADPTTPNVANTVLMGTGYKRNRYTVSGWIVIADLASMLAYLKAKSSNNLTVYVVGNEIVNENCILDKLGYNIKQSQQIVQFNMTLVSTT